MRGPRVRGQVLSFAPSLKALAFVPSLVNRIPRCNLPGHFAEDGVRSCQMPNAINNAIKLGQVIDMPGEAVEIRSI